MNHENATKQKKTVNGTEYAIARKNECDMSGGKYSGKRREQRWMMVCTIFNQIPLFICSTSK